MTSSESISKKNVEPKLEYFCVWSIDEKCPYDPLNGITTNISEGFNFLLKDFQSWQEVPLDCIVMSLKMLQGYYSEESRRGKSGLGNYSLKDKYSGLKLDVELFQPKKLTCHPRDIVNSTRNKEINFTEQSVFREEKNGTFIKFKSDPC